MDAAMIWALWRSGAENGKENVYHHDKRPKIQLW
jgi:hypothetical protein